jgi:hypothetical protein
VRSLPGRAARLNVSKWTVWEWEKGIIGQVRSTILACIFIAQRQSSSQLKKSSSWMGGRNLPYLHGTPIGMRVNDPRILDRLPPAWKPSASPVVDDLYARSPAASANKEKS